jgi:hypothetical protein
MVRFMADVRAIVCRANDRTSPGAHTRTDIKKLPDLMFYNVYASHQTIPTRRTGKRQVGEPPHAYTPRPHPLPEQSPFHFPIALLLESYLYSNMIKADRKQTHRHYLMYKNNQRKLFHCILLPCLIFES